VAGQQRWALIIENVSIKATPIHGFSGEKLNKEIQSVYHKKLFHEAIKTAKKFFLGRLSNTIGFK
jgi:hypothetical protein